MKRDCLKISPDISAKIANMGFLCAILVVNVYHLCNARWTFFLRFERSSSLLQAFISDFHMKSLDLSLWAAGILAISGSVMMVVGDQLLSWMGIPVLMLGLWSLFDGGAWPTSVTGCAFAVYALHSFVGTIAGLIMKMGGLPLDSALVWLVKVVFMATFSIAIALLMKRMFPRVASIVFGGRGCA